MLKQYFAGLPGKPILAGRRTVAQPKGCNLKRRLRQKAPNTLLKINSDLGGLMILLQNAQIPQDLEVPMTIRTETVYRVEKK